MSGQTNGQAPAFGYAVDPQSDRQFGGLTKREYMATQVLLGLISNAGHHIKGGSEIQNVTENAVTIAEVLLDKLEKPWK